MQRSIEFHFVECHPAEWRGVILHEHPLWVTPSLSRKYNTRLKTLAVNKSLFCCKTKHQDKSYVILIKIGRAELKLILFHYRK
jgi:hypothetical protein